MDRAGDFPPGSQSLPTELFHSEPSLMEGDLKYLKTRLTASILFNEGLFYCLGALA